MPWTNIDWDTAKANLESMYNGEVQSAMLAGYRISGGSFRTTNGPGGAIDSDNVFGVYGTTGSISTSSRPILYK